MQIGACASLDVHPKPFGRAMVRTLFARRLAATATAVIAAAAAGAVVAVHQHRI